MKNAGNKRLMLLLLAMTMLVCGVMGSTFATQVDKVNTNETVLHDEDGAYRVYVKYHDGQGYNAILSSEAPVFTKDTLWCPGYTKIVYLELTSDEAFPVECSLTMTASDSMLNKVMDYTLLGGIKPGADNHPKNWQEIDESIIHDLTDDPITIIEPITIDDKTAHYYAIAVHMAETAGNEYQDKELDIKFNLAVNANYKPGATAPFPDPQ